MARGERVCRSASACPRKGRTCYLPGVSVSVHVWRPVPRRVTPAEPPPVAVGDRQDPPRPRCGRSGRQHEVGNRPPSFDDADLAPLPCWAVGPASAVSATCSAGPALTCPEIDAPGISCRWPVPAALSPPPTITLNVKYVSGAGCAHQLPPSSRRPSFNHTGRPPRVGARRRRWLTSASGCCC